MGFIFQPKQLQVRVCRANFQNSKEKKIRYKMKKKHNFEKDRSKSDKKFNKSKN